MRGMFSEYNNLESIDVSYFDTSNATDISSMFYHCDKLEYIDLSNFIEKKQKNCLL